MTRAQLGAPDHYHEGEVEYDENGQVIRCGAHPKCEVCGDGNPLARGGYCIMDQMWENQYVLSGDTENIYCPDCEADMINKIIEG